MEKTDQKFNPDGYRSEVPMQIRFNDIDILGHLNNTVYFSIFDTGKAQYLQDVMKGSMRWDRVESVIANINCSFVNSVVYGEPISVYTRCEEVREKSFRLHQVMVNSDTMQIKAICDTIMVSYDPDSKSSIPVSDNARRLLNEYEGRDLYIPPISTEK